MARLAAISPAERYGGLVAALATVLASLGVAGRLGLTPDQLAQLGSGLVTLVVLGRAALQAWRAEPTAPAAAELAAEVLSDEDVARALAVLQRAAPKLPVEQVRAAVDTLQAAVATGRPVVERHLRPEERADG